MTLRRAVSFGDTNKNNEDGLVAEYQAIFFFIRKNELQNPRGLLQS
nr:MAG TPA: hypothetical protein [Caudoviricetes sp.]